MSEFINLCEIKRKYKYILIGFPSRDYSDTLILHGIYADKLEAEKDMKYAKKSGNGKIMIAEIKDVFDRQFDENETEKLNFLIDEKIRQKEDLETEISELKNTIKHSSEGN